METTYLQGIDVSHFQGSIDWTKVTKSGISYTMIKASQGTSFVDPNFETNWTGAQKKGLGCGAYHYFLPTESFISQADVFITLLKSVGYNPESDLRPAVDCEEMDSCSNATYVFALGNFLSLLELFLGVKPMIYTSPSFWNNLGNPNFGSHPLWLADYAETPAIPEPWSAFTIWQYSDSGTVNGIDGPVDLDKKPEGTNLLQSNRPTLDWF